MSTIFFCATAALVVTLLLLATSSADAFTFSMAPGTQKCFTDELTQSHRIHLDYSMARARAVFTQVTITDPNGKLVYDEKRSTAKGHFVFHPSLPGEHAVCFYSTERRAPVSMFDVTFTMLAEFEVQTQRSMEYLTAQTSSGASSSSDANQKNKALMVQAKYASENLVAINEEFRGHMDREARMRITTETAFTRSTVMSVLSILIISGVAYFGYLTLKRHLVKMKLLE